MRAQDWLDGGLKLLSAKGFGALTLDHLCERMQKTKGSFYHHFKDMNSYIGRLLDRWQEKQTQAAIDKAESAEDPKARMELLDQTVRGLDHRLDQIIRAWALRDARAAAALAVVDGMRVAYIQKLLEESGVRPETANLLAELEYTAFLGAQQRFKDMDSKKALALANGLREAMHAYVKSKDAVESGE